MAANKAPGCPPGELRTLKLAGMMYAKAQDEADAEALADSTLPQPPADIQAKTDSAVLAMLGAHQAKRRRKRRVTYLLRTAAVVANALSSIDTEDSSMYQINISSYEAQLFIKNNRQSSSIVIFLPSNLIYIQGALSEKDIIKIANNIHNLK